MAAPAIQSPNFFTILSDTNRIICSHRRHFLALSVLFILPYSLYLISLNISHPQTQTLIIALSYLVAILSLFSTGTVTYSTSRALSGNPVSLSASIKSLSLSFFPLLATLLAIQLLLILISAAFAIFLFLLTLGFGADFGSRSLFLGLCVGLSVVLISVIIHLQVSWSLAFVVVVVESKWGFEPLRQSTSLVKGMRSTALALFWWFGIVTGLIVWLVSNPNYLNFTDLFWCLDSVALIVGGSILVTFFILYNCASNTVLYMYCKANQGELAFKIAEEFAGEYLSLPIDDAKLAHVSLPIDDAKLAYVVDMAET